MAARTRPPARIERFLREDPVVWLSTVRPDGFPHLVPIWFSWDGEAVLIASKPHAQKVENIRHDGRVMLALGEEEADFDVGLIEGRAELLDLPAASFLPARHFEKYADELDRTGLSREEYLATYSQAIRIVPTRYLDWRGRTRPAPAVRRLPVLPTPRMSLAAS